MECHVVRWCTMKLENFIIPIDAFRNERARNLGVQVHSSGKAILIEKLGIGDLSGWLTDYSQHCWQLRIDMIYCKGLGSGEICQEVMFPAFWRSTGLFSCCLLWANGYQEFITVAMGDLRRYPLAGEFSPEPLGAIPLPDITNLPPQFRVYSKYIDR